MTPEHYAYWLKGYFEISDSNNLSPTQVQIIRDHLDLVFEKVTPDRTTTPTLSGYATWESENADVDKRDWRKLMVSGGYKEPIREETRYC